MADKPAKRTRLWVDIFICHLLCRAARIHEPMPLNVESPPRHDWLRDRVGVNTAMR
jgi:hypothetical protein